MNRKPGPGSMQATVLVVDDDPSVLEYITTLLEEYGYGVIPSANATKAMELLQVNRADVVLTDITMPGVSGIEFLAHVRTKYPGMPVILMTAYADLDTAVDAIKTGAFDFIIKPFKYEQLIHSIEKAVHYFRLMQMESDYRHILEEFNQGIETLVSERTMSLMALNVADKLRNPVTVIGLTAKKILEETEIPEGLSSGMGSIVEEVKKLETIVNDFHNVLKSKQSLFRYEDINDIVANLVPIIEKEAAYKGVNISINLSERSLKINVEKNLLRIAILHILRNAIEATGKGGRVTVETSGNMETVTLSVSDTGSGMAKEEIDRIFEPFYSSRMHRFGMGLPLVKQIVSEHMGKIDVDSEPGRGTTFSMVFPVRWLGSK